MGEGVNAGSCTEIVPTLCVVMHPVTLRVTHARVKERGASQAAFPRGAWERSAPAQPTADRGRNGLGEGFSCDCITAR